MNNEITEALDRLNALVDDCVAHTQNCVALAQKANDMVGGLLWHPFPAEKPPHNGKYLTSCEFRDGSKLVQIIEWRSGYFTTLDDWNAPKTIMDECVRAWIELPKPYERGEGNG